MEKAVMIQKEDKVEKMAKLKTRAKLNRAISLQRLRKGATKLDIAADTAEC